MKTQTETVIKLAIALPIDAIQSFCQRWQIAELSVFGSILRDDFNADSDVDFLYALKPNTRWRLLDLMDAEEELEKMLGRKVDLVKKSNIEQSHNWLRKQNILSSAKVIYGDRTQQIIQNLGKSER
ncbi:nucleotidyltransferase domain-containing protein [Cronbergia sp. UHCC 0137]|uniref:nucleotidyltransferase family protein n=1 Tax=Cronbergia sp. UHCC 0137 TaxID=3110239 RepID=UPI002B219ABD|nr:nucleotidyltransferase domain-containing protein [Cronbergia sp. UHCC 0137]MEA5617957.1 nucleotidyltransferase domain-containing protein [Cronbergia sp. UHCC 0137]